MLPCFVLFGTTRFSQTVWTSEEIQDRLSVLQPQQIMLLGCVVMMQLIGRITKSTAFNGMHLII